MSTRRLDLSPESSDPQLVRLGLALRAVQDRVAHTRASPELVVEAAEALERVVALRLEPHMYDVATDRSWDDVVRTSVTRTLSPGLRDLVFDGDRLDATVRFTPFHLGANGAAHGGTLPIVFDEALARVTNEGRGLGRTAWLKVDYRNVTLVGRDLQVTARLDRIEGRKRYASAVLSDGDVVTAEATGLYVELRPESP